METKRWLKHYDAGMPHTLQPYPERTLLDVVAAAARERPSHTFSIFKSARLSYAEFERLTDAFGAALVALGVNKGDCVALIMPNCPQFLIAQFGAWKAGAMVAAVNPIYTERELEHGLNECGAETVVVLTPFYNKIKSLQPRTKIKRVLATNIKEYLPPLLRVLFTLAKEKKEGHRITVPDAGASVGNGGDVWLGDLLKQHAGAARPHVAVKPSDPALLLFTGGTTGMPKAAVGSHHALVMAGMQLHAWFGNVLVDWDDVGMLNMPLFHVMGNVGVLNTFLIGRNPLAIVPNPRDLTDLLETVHKTHPAFLPGVPTLYTALLNHPSVQSGKVSLKSIKACISGAAPLLAETKHRFEAATGGRIVEGYALTESMMAACITPLNGAYKEGSVGMPLPDVEARIVDLDSAQVELGPNQSGEIVIRAPQLMLGYLNRPEETAKMIRDGWLYSGDIGHMDEEGYLFITDRKKDLIKTSGFQVWPREVEEILAAHPAVAEVAVAGVFDEYQGEAVKAWIVVAAGKQTTADEIRAYCREHLAAYKVPKHVAFRESLPKTMVGKVLRRELVAEDKAARAR